MNTELSHEGSNTGFARIRNLMTRQRHDVRLRDEMLELAIQL